MHKIMQSNLSQGPAIYENSKPLWSVNKNPRSRVVNYKTEQG